MVREVPTLHPSQHVELPAPPSIITAETSQNNIIGDMLDKHVTRGVIRGRSTAVYDMRYLPMDDVLRPKRAASLRQEEDVGEGVADISTSDGTLEISPDGKHKSYRDIDSGYVHLPRRCSWRLRRLRRKYLEKIHLQDEEHSKAEVSTSNRYEVSVNGSSKFEHTVCHGLGKLSEAEEDRGAVNTTAQADTKRKTVFQYGSSKASVRQQGDTQPPRLSESTVVATNNSYVMDKAADRGMTGRASERRSGTAFRNISALKHDLVCSPSSSPFEMLPPIAQFAANLRGEHPKFTSPSQRIRSVKQDCLRTPTPTQAPAPLDVPATRGRKRSFREYSNVFNIPYRGPLRKMLLHDTLPHEAQNRPWKLACQDPGFTIFEDGWLKRDGVKPAAYQADEEGAGEAQGETSDFEDEVDENIPPDTDDEDGISTVEEQEHQSTPTPPYRLHPTIVTTPDSGEQDVDLDITSLSRDWEMESGIPGSSSSATLDGGTVVENGEAEYFPLPRIPWHQ